MVSESSALEPIEIYEVMKWSWQQFCGLQTSAANDEQIKLQANARTETLMTSGFAACTASECN